MAKTQKRETQVSAEQFTFVLNNGIKIYPISIYDEDEYVYKRYVQVDDNGKITTYSKTVSPNDLNDAIAKTIIYYYNELKKERP
jgi:hypothetical protein